MAKAGREAGEQLGAGIVRGADGRLRDSRGKFVKAIGAPAETERQGRGIGRRLADGIVGGLSGGVGHVKKTLTTVFQGGLKGALSTPVLGPILIAAGTSAAATLGPAIATAVSGGIVAGIGAGVVGAGTAALFHVEEINKEWSKSEQKRVAESNKQAEKLRRQYALLGRDIIGGMKEAAQPLVPVLDTVRSTLREVGSEFKPALKQAFEIVQGPLRSFTKNLGKGFLELKPALEPLMLAFAGILNQMGPQLPAFFESLAQSLIELGTVANENRDLIAGVFLMMLHTIPMVIDTVSGLTSAFRSVLSFMTEGWMGFLGVIKNVMAALGNIPGFDWATRAAADLQEAINKARGFKEKLDDFPKIVKLEGDVRDLDIKIAKAKAKLNDPNLTRTRRAKLQADIKQLLAEKARAQAAIDSLRGKTVYMSVKAAVPAGVSLRQLMNAHGGIIGGAGARFATGGISGSGSSMALVGEEGPELVRLPFGSSVIPAGTTRSMLEAEREARKGAVGDLTVSRFGRLAGNRTTEFANALGSPEGVRDLVSSLNQWRSTIRQTTHGRTESRLLRDLDVAGKALIKNERLQTKVNAALEKAKDKLDQLKNSFAQLRDSVASGITSFGSITGTPDDRALSVGGIIGSMSDRLGQARNFSSALSQLRKRGLNGASLAEIAQAGVEGGGRMAQTLLSASGSQIDLINSLQGQLKSTAKTAGTVTADAMYGAGIKAAEGIVKGLEKNQARIEKAMMHIAASMEKAIRKALGIRGRAHGGIIGAAAGGPRGAMTLVGEQGPELVNLPFGSSVIPAGQTRSMMAAAASGGGWGGGPTVLEIRSGGTRLDDLLVEVLRNAIRARGGNVQVVLGRRS